MSRDRAQTEPIRLIQEHILQVVAAIFREDLDWLRSGGWYEVFDRLLQDIIACSGRTTMSLGYLNLRLSLSHQDKNRTLHQCYTTATSPDIEHQFYVCYTQWLRRMLMTHVAYSTADHPLCRARFMPPPLLVCMSLSPHLSTQGIRKRFFRGLSCT